MTTTHTVEARHVLLTTLATGICSPTITGAYAPESPTPSLEPTCLATVLRRPPLLRPPVARAPRDFQSRGGQSASTGPLPGTATPFCRV